MLVPSGGYKQGMVDNEGRWVEKSELTPYTEVGEPMPNYPSSFDAPIELKNTVSAEEFLDNDWESVYQLVNAELAAAVGEKIYKFEFSYRRGTNHNDGYLLNTPGGLFLFAGDKQEFPFVTLSEQTVIDDMEEEVEEEIDDLERKVYKKVSGSKVMIHKFLIWKTNKEASGKYPAYVFYHTDFSNSRKEMIKRDMAFSSDETQIREILSAEIADNIKKVGKR